MEFTDDEITTLKKVVTAYKSATTIARLPLVSSDVKPSQLVIEVSENGTSRRANLGNIVAKEFVPATVKSEAIETQAGISTVLVYDSYGNAHIIPFSKLCDAIIDIINEKQQAVSDQ